MRRVGPILLAVVVAVSSGSSGVGQSPPDKAPHVTAARNRQEAVKSVSVEFKRTEVDAPGGVTRLGGLGIGTEKSIPPEETTFDSVNRFVIAGEKVRYEWNHPVWHIMHGKLMRQRSVRVFDGTYSKALRPRGMTGDEGPAAEFEEGLVNDLTRGPELIPIVMAFRGTSTRLAPYLYNDMKPTGVTLPIEGAPCQEYTIKPSSPNDSG